MPALGRRTGGLPEPLPDSPPGPVVIPLAEVIDETRTDLASAEESATVDWQALAPLLQAAMAPEATGPFDPTLEPEAPPPEAGSLPGDLPETWGADAWDDAPPWALALAEKVDTLNHAVALVGNQQQWMVDAFGAAMLQFQQMMGSPGGIFKMLMGGGKKGAS